jgi:hypothetical protein
MEVSLTTVGRELHLRLYEWLVGSLVLAPVFAVLAGFITYGIARLPIWRRDRAS